MQDLCKVGGCLVRVSGCAAGEAVADAADGADQLVAQQNRG